MFRSFASVVEAALGAYFTLSTPMQSDEMHKIVAQHASIADAIEKRETETAAAAMLVVIDEGRNRVAVTQG
jgi:DNA-binding FadR family transcriptional regulator